MSGQSFIPAIILLSTAVGCSTSKTGMTVSPSEGGTAVGWNHRHEVEKTDTTTTILLPGQSNPGGIRGGGQSAEIPKVRIYKTNGNYADNVPVTLDASRTKLLSFPAPSDLRGSAPVKLDNGFLLDRRGVGPATAFTRWTYEEYSALPSAPGTKEIMDNLIPGAAVTELYEMPFTIGTPDAAERCNELIKEGLPGCTPLLQSVELK